MAINPINFQTPQAWSGGADFSSLANLGNVYRQGQEQAAQQQALSRLGDDPTVNAQILAKSGVPSLAQLGLTMQSQQQQRAEQRREFEAQQKIREAAEKRAQETFERSDPEEAAKLIAGLGQPPAAPSPFPSPTTAPQGLPQSALQPQAPSPTDAAVSSLTSNQPAAGISREQLGQLIANPLTHDLGIALLQKQVDPGKYTYQQIGDQLVRLSERGEPPKVIMTDTKPIQIKEGENLAIRDPNAPGGFRVIQPEGGMTKAQREFADLQTKADQLGLQGRERQLFLANAKLPTTDEEKLSPQERKRIDTLTDQVQTAQRTLGNVAQLKELSKTAWGFPGAGALSSYGATFLPEWLGGKGAVDARDLANAAHSNVANVAKSIFPQRVTNTDLKLLQELESSADQPDVERQRIYKRTEDMFSRMINEATAEADAIRNKTFYKPGGGIQPATTAPATTGSITKPPDRIVNKAKAAIAQGADPKQVRQHMIDNGFDPGDIGK